MKSANRTAKSRAIPASALAVHARALANLQAGRADLAEAELGAVLQTLPDWAEGYHLHGLIAQAEGQLVRAQARLERAVALDPGVANFHTNLAVVLLGRRMPSAAVVSCTTALRLDPKQFGAMLNLGLALAQLGRVGDALATFEKALALRADFAPLHGNIGRMENLLGHYGAALMAFQRAAQLAPDNPEYAMGQATNLYLLGRSRDCDAVLAEMIGRWPTNLQALGARTFLLNHFAEITPNQQAAAARAYGAACERLMQPRQHRPDPAAVDKVLRIGLVSPDLRDHSVSLFLRPLLARLDRSRFALVAYSTSSHADATTAALRPEFAEWVDAAMLSHDQLAERIAHDRIDILLDLAGHTQGGRLPVFARKPAPVSAAWMGYSGTTGLSAIDYLVCDDYVVPHGDEAMISERPWRLPHGFLCAPHNSDVAPVKRSDRAEFTFGSFNSHNKLSEATVETWAEILRKVGGSRLLLKSRALADGAEREATAARFAALGVDPARLTLLGRTPTVADHLALYGDMDVALDPFPYNGTTTTMQALRMGVPVITLQGDRFISRVGASLLANAGLDDWIAPDVAGYVALAQTWAGDRAGLARLRDQLPGRMVATPMSDRDGFARDFGDMLVGMWRRWCLGADTSASSP